MQASMGLGHSGTAGEGSSCVNIAWLLTKLCLYRVNEQLKGTNMKNANKHYTKLSELVN